MLVSEQVLTLSNQVGVLTNRAYVEAPMLVSDLQGLAVDLRGLYEAVLEIEPSREDLRRAEVILREYPRKKRRLALAMAEQVDGWIQRAEAIDSATGISSPSQGERVQGGTTVAVAHKILEQEETLLEGIRFSDRIQNWYEEIKKVEVALCGVPQRLRELIACRYFGGLPIDDVCEKLAISRATFYRMRDEALLDFQATMDGFTFEDGEA